jgi:hypothetical protein
MKKFLRGYFLLFASHPIFYSLVLATVAVFGYYFFTNAPLPKEGELNKPLMIVLAITIIHAILVYAVISKYITRNAIVWADFLNDDDTTLFHYVTIKNGKKIIFSKPIWEKGEITHVHLPDDCTREVWTFDDCMQGECSAKTNLICNYKQLEVYIPIVIKVILDDNFNHSEVLAALTQYGDNFTTNSIACYMTYCFRMANKEQQDKLDALTKRLAEKTISELDYIDEVAGLINFPGKLFSNFKRTTIEIGNPVILCKKDADAPKKPKGIIEVSV